MKIIRNKRKVYLLILLTTMCISKPYQVPIFFGNMLEYHNSLFISHLIPVQISSSLLSSEDINKAVSDSLYQFQCSSQILKRAAGEAGLLSCSIIL